MSKFVRVARPLIALVAACGLIGAAQPVVLDAQDQADATCLAAISIVTGQVAESEPEQKEGLVSVLTYYVGKLKGRHPDMHMTEVLTPDFVHSVMTNLSNNMERCSKEALELGKDLDETGNALTAAGS
jgi:hypothetical protein